MLEIYFDERGELAVESLPALLKAFPQYTERATASALNSEGYRLKNLIQDAIKNRGVHGEWDELNPHTGVLSRANLSFPRKGSLKNYKKVWKGKKGSKRRVNQYWQVKLSTRKNPLAKLAGAVRYKYDDDIQLVRIGFFQSAGVSSKLLQLAGIHAKGFNTSVTPRMRKMLFALGFPIKKSTTTLKIPARPVIGPVFKQEEANIIKNVELKLLESLKRYLYGGGKKK